MTWLADGNVLAALPRQDACASRARASVVRRVEEGRVRHLSHHAGHLAARAHAPLRRGQRGCGLGGVACRVRASGPRMVGRSARLSGCAPPEHAGPQTGDGRLARRTGSPSRRLHRDARFRLRHPARRRGGCCFPDCCSRALPFDRSARLRLFQPVSSTCATAVTIEELREDGPAGRAASHHPRLARAGGRRRRNRCHRTVSPRRESCRARFAGARRSASTALRRTSPCSGGTSSGCGWLSAATARQLFALVVRQALRPVLIGAVLGIGAALASGGLLGSFLFENRSRPNPGAFGAATVLLLVSPCSPAIFRRAAPRKRTRS